MISSLAFGKYEHEFVSRTFGVRSRTEQLGNAFLRALASKKIYIFKNERIARWAFSTMRYEGDKKVISERRVRQTSWREILFMELFRNFLWTNLPVMDCMRHTYSA